MKTLIVYGSKYGSTEQCAKLLSEALHEGATLVNLSKRERPKPEDFDMIVVGSPIYEDKILSSVHRFCVKHKPVLLKKNFACFLCNTSLPSTVHGEFTDNFDEDFLAAAVAKASFGGALDWDKLSHADRLLYGKETYKQSVASHIMLHPDKIKSFALALELNDKDYKLEET